MTTVQEIMRSVSEVLTTAEELNAEGDGEQVGIMLASFLKTLLVDLDKMAVAYPETTRPPRHRGADQYRDKPTKKYARADASKPKRPIPNKYDGKCKSCNIDVPANSGFVLPIQDGNRRWTTYCANHHDAAISLLEAADSRARRSGKS